MQIPFDGLMSPTAYRRGFVRHYQPPRGEMIFRLVGMMVIAAVLVALFVLGFREPAVWIVGVVISLMLALPWLWPSLLAGAAWRAKLRSGIHERGFVTGQALVFVKHVPDPDSQGSVVEETSIALSDLLKVRVFEDMLLLYHTPNAFSIIPQELLVNQGQWHQLVQQVLARVPDHDRLPRKKSWALAVAYVGIVVMLALVLWQSLQH